MNGKPSSRAVSYISFAHSQFQDRCLSLNTGTARPLDAKHFDDLLKELVARILRLALFVARILAVLADNDDAIDRQLAAAERQRFGDRRIHLHRREALGALAAQVAIVDLIDVERHQVHRRMMMCAIPAVAFEEPVDDVLRVGILEVRRRDRGDFRPCRPRLRARQKRRGSRARQQLAARDLAFQLAWRLDYRTSAGELS